MLRTDETGTAAKLFRLNVHGEAGRTACPDDSRFFREETRRKTIFLKQTEKVKQNFTRTASFFQKRRRPRDATPRNHPQNRFLEKSYFLAAFFTAFR